MFDHFDEDGSQSISIDELRKTFSGLNINQEGWEDMIRGIDVDGSGEIEFDEFKKMMSDLIKN